MIAGEHAPTIARELLELDFKLLELEEDMEELLEIPDIALLDTNDKLDLALLELTAKLDKLDDVLDLLVELASTLLILELTFDDAAELITTTIELLLKPTLDELTELAIAEETTED